MNFDTGVEDLPDQPADLTREFVPPDDGLGNPGNGEFNTPTLVEAADTGPFFHNNSVETVEGAVEFYNGDSFNNSPAGQLLQGATGSGINLDATQTVAVAAFLRVINALENIRAGLELLETAVVSEKQVDFDNLRTANEEIDDAIMVLSGGGLHPQAVLYLRDARALTERAASLQSQSSAREAIPGLERARDELVESQ